MPQQTLVSVAELADQVFGNSFPAAHSWIQRTKAKVVTDWRGEEAVSEADARKIVEGFEREKAAHVSKYQQYEAFKERRSREQRDYAASEAAKVRAQELRADLSSMADYETNGEYHYVSTTGLASTPRSGAAAQAAYRAAFVEYEKKNPLPSFENFRG
jgi:hypothetical protein